MYLKELLELIEISYFPASNNIYRFYLHWIDVKISVNLPLLMKEAVRMRVCVCGGGG